jgi:transcriptional regulator with XRE-family HTH domain
VSDDELYKIVGNNIRSLRLQKGISQSKLGCMCEFEKSTISRLETRRTNPTLSTLRKIADALDVSICSLLES